MLTLKSTEIPKLLRQIDQPPKNLYILGNDIRIFENIPKIAVVGSRRLSNYGRQVTDKLASELSRAGVVIISGLALGVDSVAHQACLDAGGITVAVLPSSVTNIYPRSHLGLAKDIVVKGGSLVSEINDPRPPMQHSFLIRNRLISGLTDATLITEAAERSGSLNTARHALEQGKTVFAVPGNITSELSAGTNNLIKAGAIPVTCVDDILQNMNWARNSLSEQTSLFKGTPAEETIIHLLQEGVSSAAELQAKSELNQADFNQALTMLEIYGQINPLGANSWTLR